MKKRINNSKEEKIQWDDFNLKEATIDLEEIKKRKDINEDDREHIINQLEYIIQTSEKVLN